MQSILTLRKRALLIAALIVFSSCHHASSPKVNFTGHWTNGLEDYILDASTDSTWVFPGGNFHEGGLSFGVKLHSNGQYIICPVSEIDTDYKFPTDPSAGKIGDKIVYKNVDTNRVILIESRKGDIHDVLLNVDTTVELGKFYERNQVIYDLSGVYQKTDSKQTIVFAAEPGHVEGLTQGNTYTIETTYDNPTNVLTFGESSHLWYERNEDTLVLYNAVRGGDEDWTRGEALMTLHRISRIDLPEYDGRNGKYSFASTEVMLPGILCFFSKDQLRIMRNEIYARKGFIFSAPDLKAYFGSKPWYAPRFASVDNKLTALEKLNVEIIKQFEIHGLK
jgi:hypothetical protein